MMPDMNGRTGRKVEVIAKPTRRKKALRTASAHGLVIAAVCLSLASCTSSLDLFGPGNKVDRSLSTGTIPTTAASAGASAGATMSDEVTVKNAVTSADLSKVGATNTVPWANSATGSAGVVSSIREDESEGQVCRAFQTTRHSYDGIAMFNGQACRAGSGDWMLTAFNRQ